MVRRNEVNLLSMYNRMGMRGSRGQCRGGWNADGTKAVATLNGTLVAIPRMIVAILENHQNADGTINVPAALQPFLGMTRFELV